VPAAHLSAASLVFIGCLVAGAAAADEGAVRDAPPPAPPAVAAADSKAPEVKIESFIDTTVCRNERPTGSKIAVKRCYTRTKGDGSQQETAADAVARRDLEDLRQQQMQAALARQIARQTVQPQR
jgi:hypothetical protein